jgi:uncharacterized membrane protein HdeD (DUF308 family)
MTDVAAAPVGSDDSADYAGAGCLWWGMLFLGAAWVLIAFAILGFDPTSVTIIGVMTGLVILLAGLTELTAIVVDDGWKWVHAGLGIVFVVTGVLAMFAPFQTFGILALLIGWYLIVRGTFGVVFTLLARHEMHLWGLTLGAAIIELLIGIWAVGYPGRSGALLILWVGIAALVRGITQIVFAFRLRSDAHAAA